MVSRRARPWTTILVTTAGLIAAAVYASKRQQVRNRQCTDALIAAQQAADRAWFIDLLERAERREPAAIATFSRALFQLQNGGYMAFEDFAKLHGLTEQLVTARP